MSQPSSNTSRSEYQTGFAGAALAVLVAVSTKAGEQISKALAAEKPYVKKKLATKRRGHDRHPSQAVNMRLDHYPAVLPRDRRVMPVRAESCGFWLLSQFMDGHLL